MRNNRALCLAILAATSVFLTACGGGDASGPETLDFSVVDTDPLSGIHTARFTVTQNSADWSALWLEHKGGTQAPPLIDFSQKMAIGVFLGQRPGGCFSVAIKAVTRSSEKITVQYKESVPEPGANCPAIIVFPSQIATIPLSNLPVDFVQAN